MWDQRYSQPGFAYGSEANDFLAAAAVQLQPQSHILSLAEGEGRNATFLAKLGHRVTAVDSSRVGLQKAQSLARERGVAIETIEADLARFEIDPGSYQAIVSIFCHLPSAMRKRLHRKAVDGLAPGGLFILEGFSKRQLEFNTGGPSDIGLLLDLAEITRELQGLAFSHARETERDICEGSYHNGRGAVIQIIGTKPDGKTL